MVVASLLCAFALIQSSSPAIYFVRKDSIYRSFQGTETLVLKHAAGPALSPDGKQLAFLREGDLYLLDLESSESKRCSHLAETPATVPDHDPYPSWDPASKFIIFGHPDKYTVTRRNESADPMFGVEHSSKTIWNVYWCWTKRVGTKGAISLFLGNETSGPSAFSVSSSSAASFSPDGRHVAFCRNGDLWMATLEPSSVHDLIGEASWDEARILACGTQEGGTRASNETSSIYRIAWSPDGKLLALSSDRYGTMGSPQIQIVKSDRPSEKVDTFAGWDACFMDSGKLLYCKPYTHSHDIWLRDLDSKDEKIAIVHGSGPAVAAK